MIDAAVTHLKPTKHYGSAWGKKGQFYIQNESWKQDTLATELTQWLNVAANVKDYPGLREPYPWCVLVEHCAPWDDDPILTGRWLAAAINYTVNLIFQDPEAACSRHNAAPALGYLENKLHRYPQHIQSAVNEGLDLPRLAECYKQHGELIDDSMCTFHDSDPGDSYGGAYLLESLIYNAITHAGFTPPPDVRELYDNAWFHLPHHPFSDPPESRNRVEVQRLMAVRPYSLGVLLSSICQAPVYDPEYDGLFEMDITKSPPDLTMKGFLDVYFEHYKAGGPDASLWQKLKETWPDFCELMTLHVQLYNTEQESYDHLDTAALSWMRTLNKTSNSHDVIALPELV